MKYHHAKQLYRAIACALFAGIVAAPFAAQTAYALPIEGANAAANAEEANISKSGAVMDIVGKTQHNILRWEDFSIDAGEKVRFDGGAQTRDYLNLVTGEGASNIYGTIEGGRNVYLVNPHGILFAKGSEVNTGALYLSTANVDAVASAAGTSWGGNSPLTASTQYGNVLNLGTVQTAKLYIEGNNVTVLNTDDVKNAAGNAPLTGANVTIRSAQTPHIGYDVANRATANFDESGGSVSHSFYDYANPNTSKSASGRGWDVANLGGAAHTDYDYMCVHDVYDLQNINAKRDGRYILAGDIDATATTHWNGGKGFAPLGDGGNKFTGRLDGAGHTLRRLYINRQVDIKIGLFGSVKEATIENLSLRDGNVKAEVYVGGIVGIAEEAVIRNVSYSGMVAGANTIGGIAGYIENSSIQNAWNAATVKGSSTVGGIAGSAKRGSTFQNVCNTGAIRGPVAQSGGIAGYIENSSIQNAWNAGTVSGRSQFLAGGIVGRAIYNAVIQNVCNTGAITGRMYIGGIVGGTWDNCTIQNAWNTGAVTGSELVGGIVGGMQNDCIVQNVWNTGTVTGNQKVGGIVGEADGGSIRHAVWKSGSAGQAVGALSNGADATTDVKFAAEAQMKQTATYTDWKDAHGNAIVATEGGKGTPWRIYEGHTMPLLTALMKGTKRLEKVYDGNVFATTDPHITLVNTGKDVGIYDAYSDQFGYDLIGGAVIKSRVLTLSGVAAQNKTYDGTTAADISKFHATLNNVVSGEESLVTATATGATYNSKDVASANAVNYTGVALGGTGAGNYTLAANTAQGAGRITPKQLTLVLTSGARFDKTYDGTANVAQSLTKGTNYTLANFVTGEGTGIELAPATGTYTDKNAAADKAVTFDGLTLTGTGAGNYVLNSPTLTGTGTIARRALTLGTVAAQSKTYDGTTAADASKFGATLNNAVAGDNVTATATGAVYNDKNVAAANRIDYTGVALAGAESGNYTLAATTAQGAGTISRRALTVGTVTAQSKTYDGTTAADAAAFHATLGNVVAGEENSVAATAAGAAYNDKNVARANAVNYTGVALQGAGAGNYTIATTAEGRGTITPRALTLGAVAAQTKTYDGTTDADTSKFGAVLNNAVAGDNVMAAAAGAAYNDKNVAAANRIDYTGVALRGADAGNYTLAVTAAQGAGMITHRELTLTAAPHSIVQGEPLPSFTGRAEGFADGEDASVLGAGGLTFESAVTNTETPGSYGVTGRIGGVTDGVLGNYRIRQAPGNATALTIHAANLPGGILASLVQDAKPVFDDGFSKIVYLFGTPRPVRAATLGLYRFDAERGLEIQGLNL